MAASDSAADSEVIADQAALQLFSNAAPSERKVTEALRGVLAETACTGIIRFEWPLIRDLVAHQIDVQLRMFEAAERVDVGPARPLESGDIDLSATIQRFTELLKQFEGAPWTLQRLCELLLEPRKQYQRLHKLVLALEKLLLVTGEVAVTQSPPPPPQLNQLRRVNDPPIAACAANSGSLAGQKRSRPEDAEATRLVTVALTITAKPGQPQSTAADAEDAANHSPAAAEDDKGDKENEGGQQAGDAGNSAAVGASRAILQDSQDEAATTGAVTAVAMDIDPAPAVADGGSAAAAASDGPAAAEDAAVAPDAAADMHS